MDRFKVTTRVLITDGDRILLVRDAGRRFWYPPGGHLEPGGDVRACAAREVAEETGLRIEVGPLAYVGEWVDGPRVTVLYFLATVAGGDLRTGQAGFRDVGGPVRAARWCRRAELQRLNVDRPCRTLLRQRLWDDLASGHLAADLYRRVLPDPDSAWQPAPGPFRLRPRAAALVLDPAGRILMTYSNEPGVEFWQPPGGESRPGLPEVSRARWFAPSELAGIKHYLDVDLQAWRRAGADRYLGEHR